MTDRMLVQTLKEIGISPDTIRTVRSEAKNAGAPEIGRKILERLHAKLVENGRAVVILGKNGKYSIFTPEGLKAISDSTKSRKPWTMRTKQ